MTKSAVASTMQTRRTIATSPSTKRLKRSSTAPPDMRWATVSPPPSLSRPLEGSEVFLRLEDEGHRLLDTEALRLLADEPRDRLHEGRLVGVDDLGEVALELLEVLELRNLPGAAHIGLRPLPGLLERLLVLVVELVPQFHGDEQQVRDAHVLVERVELRDLVKLLGDDRGVVVLGAVDDAGLERRIELGPGHGHAGRAHRLHGLHHHRRGHHADFLALEVVRRAHWLLGEEVARA